MKNILLVEDDLNLAMLLKENFAAKGLQVHLCKDGEEGLSMFKNKKFDMCIIDVMLPKKDGFALAKEIRKIDNGAPFIFLTARSVSDDKYRGFELGCDDYVTKPFSAQELFLRVKAVMKRCHTSPESENKDLLLSIGKFTFNYDKRFLMNGYDERKLSCKEAELLFVLATNKNRLINRKYILQHVWGRDDYFTSKSMDVYLTKIRKFLRSDPNIEVINVYGLGYKLIIPEHVELCVASC